MSKLAITLSGSQFGRSLRNGTRDIVADWRHWSWAERIAAILAAVILVLVPALAAAAL